MAPEQKKNSMSVHILDNRIMRSLETLPKIQSYDIFEYLDEHVENVDNKMDHYHTQGVVNYKIFTQTVTVVGIKWFKTLPDGSIDSWKDHVIPSLPSLSHVRGKLQPWS